MPQHDKNSVKSEFFCLLNVDVCGFIWFTCRWFMMVVGNSMFKYSHSFITREVTKFSSLSDHTLSELFGYIQK